MPSLNSSLWKREEPIVLHNTSETLLSLPTVSGHAIHLSFRNGTTKAHKSTTCPVKFLYPKFFCEVVSYFCRRPLKTYQQLKVIQINICISISFSTSHFSFHWAAGRFRMKPRRSALAGKALVSSSYCDECDISPSSEDVAASMFHAFIFWNGFNVCFRDH